MHQGLQPLLDLRHSMVEITYAMEQRGISLHHPNCLEQIDTYKEYLKGTTETLKEIVSDSFNPASPQQVRDVLYDHFNAPLINFTASGDLATDKNTLEEMIIHEEAQDADLQLFIETLLEHRSNQKALEYAESYINSAVVRREKKGGKRYHVMFTNFNVTGTRTTRFSSSDPNAQNISKKKKYNLRKCFGPREGRYWLCADFSNIEMRIFAEDSKDEGLIRAFKEGRSAHMIFAQVLHPELVEELGEERFKDERADTEYGWTKNGNFSLIYGAQDKRVNATYKVPDAAQLIRHQLPTITGYMKKIGKIGRQQGFIETIGGYPLTVGREEPHKAVNYRIQGSAGIFISNGMRYCYQHLKGKKDHYMIMQVHDELIFDLPLPINKKIVKELTGYMEQGAADFGYTVPVDYKLVTESWGG